MFCSGWDSPLTELRAVALERPDAVAMLTVDGGEVTYARLIGRVDGIAGKLIAAGVSADDPVAIVASDGIDAAVAFLAAAAVGIATPLNPAGSAEEFGRAFELLAPRVLLCATTHHHPARTTADRRGLAVATLSDADATRLEQDGLAAPGSEKVALLVSTSGTTGRPRLVPLTHSNLAHSARSVRRTLELSSDDRCLNVMPLFHVHGLVAGLLASLTAGGSVVCAPALDTSRFCEWLGRTEPTWYTAVPTIHQAVLRTLADEASPPRHRLRFIRSSSAALPVVVLKDLERRFNVPVIEAYGMSEAAHQIASNPLPPAARRPGSVGLPAGADVAVLDADGMESDPGHVGEVVVRGAGVIKRYQGPAESDAENFVRGWLRTGDAGYLDDAGYLFLTGRIKELVNRGGEKIAPREVEEALLLHPGISEAAAFAVPHRTLGEVVGVAVVPHPVTGPTAAQIRAYARERLPHQKVPRHVVLVAEIPKSASGKVQRVMLADRLGLIERTDHDLSERPASRAPATPLESELLEELALAIGSEVAVDEDFIGAGCDSIHATRLAARIEERYGVDLNVADLFRLGTAQNVAVAVAERLARRFGDGDVERILAALDPHSEAT